MRIAKVTAHEVLDSRGNPTVEGEVVLDDGTTRPLSCRLALQLEKRRLSNCVMVIRVAMAGKVFSEQWRMSTRRSLQRLSVWRLATSAVLING